MICALFLCSSFNIDHLTYIIVYLSLPPPPPLIREREREREGGGVAERIWIEKKKKNPNKQAPKSCFFLVALNEISDSIDG